MNDSMINGVAIFDVVIGLAFVYLGLSIVASSIWEGIASFWRERARMLQTSIGVLLSNETLDSKSIWASFSAGTTKSPYGDAFLSHRLFTSLTRPMSAIRKGVGSKEGPSYLSGAIFTDILVDVIRKGAPGTANLSAAIDAIDDGNFKEALSSIQSSSSSSEEFKTKVRTWYDEYMERVSGWYKRRSQIFLFFVGLVLAASLEVDTIGLTRELLDNGALRVMLVNNAEQVLKNVGKDDSAPATAQPTATGEAKPRDASAEPTVALSRAICSLVEPDCTASENPEACNETAGKRQSTLKRFGLDPALLKCGLIITAGQTDAPTEEKAQWKTWLGYLLTAIAISLGAPFWMQLLGMLLSIRGSIAGRSGTRGASAPTPVPVPAGPVVAGTFAQQLTESQIIGLQMVLGLDESDQSGKLDVKTQGAIAEWENRSGLPATGLLTLETYQRILEVPPEARA